MSLIWLWLSDDEMLIVVECSSHKSNTSNRLNIRMSSVALNWGITELACLACFCVLSHHHNAFVRFQVALIRAAELWFWYSTLFLCVVPTSDFGYSVCTVVQTSTALWIVSRLALLSIISMRLLIWWLWRFGSYLVCWICSDVVPLFRRLMLLSVALWEMRLL